jgi:hypothetical protein
VHGLGAGVVAGVGELFAAREDRILDLRGDNPPRVAVRASRPRLERCIAFVEISLDRRPDPQPAQAVVASDLTLAAPFDHDRRDHNPRHRHRPPPPLSGW